MALLDLPDEIVQILLTYIEAQQDLLSCTKSCHRLYRLSQPYIYASLDLKFDQALRFFLLQSKLAVQESKTSSNAVPIVHNSSDLTAHVSQSRFIYINKLSLKGGSENLAAGYFAPWIEQLHNLQSLEIVSPYWHFNDFEAPYLPEFTQRYDEQGLPLTEQSGKYLMDWPFEQKKLSDLFQKNSILSAMPILPSLRSCYIQYREQNGQAWFLDFEPVMLSSSLTQLCLEGCFFHDQDFEDHLSDSQVRPNLQRCTPLEHLELRDCNIETISLSRMLMFPKALKSLTLSQTEHTHHEFGIDAHPAQSVEEYFEIFELQKTSLEELHMDAAPSVRDLDWSRPWDLRRFERLHTLCLGDWIENFDGSLGGNEDSERENLRLPDSLHTMCFNPFGVPTNFKRSDVVEELQRDLRDHMTAVKRIKQQNSHFNTAILQLIFLEHTSFGWMVSQPVYNRQDFRPLFPEGRSLEEAYQSIPERYLNVVKGTVLEVLWECKKEIEDTGVKLLFLATFV